MAPARPALSPAEVRVYRTAPPRYQEIALLDATSGARFFHGSPEGEAEAIARLKVEAARVGANGVLITSLGDRASGMLGVGVGGGGISGGRRNVVAGGGSVSGAAPIVSNAAAGNRDLSCPASAEPPGRARADKKLEVRSTPSLG